MKTKKINIGNTLHEINEIKSESREQMIKEYEGGLQKQLKMASDLVRELRQEKRLLTDTLSDNVSALDKAKHKIDMLNLEVQGNNLKIVTQGRDILTLNDTVKQKVMEIKALKNK